MSVYLIYLMVLLVPFFTIPGFDSRFPKEVLGVGLSLAVVLMTFFTEGLKPFKNYWLLSFILFCYVCILTAPQFNQFLMSMQTGNKIEIMLDQPVSKLWMFKASYYILVYSLFIIAVSSLDFKSHQVHFLLTLIALTSFFMALYVFIQQANLDQFFTKVTPGYNPHIKSLEKPLIGGTMGQSSLVATFISGIVPLCIFLRRYFWAGCCILAVYFTTSKMAMLALAIGLIYYFAKIEGRVSKLLIVLILASGLSWASIAINKNKLDSWDKLKWYAISQSSGRTFAWSQMIDSYKTPFEGVKRTILGIGPGSFRYDALTKKSQWWEAHNDPLEILFCFGMIGAGLVFMGIWEMLSKVSVNGIYLAVLASLLIFFISSLGTFTFQLTPNIIVACVLIGLLHNHDLKERLSDE